MQQLVKLCEYLHTFGAACNVWFARDSVHQKMEQPHSRNTSTHAVYLEARSCCTSFALAKAEVPQLPRRGIASRRGDAAAAHVERHLHRYIVHLQGFSGEDAEKSSTETDQGVDHRSRKSE
jgi:hypothetical protein